MPVVKGSSSKKDGKPVQEYSTRGTAKSCEVYRTRKSKVEYNNDGCTDVEESYGVQGNLELR